MQKRIKLLLSVVLASAVILSMATGVLATEQEHVHNWQRTKADVMFHTLVCSGCGESKTITHSFDSAECCIVCGYQAHEHVWQYGGEFYDHSHKMTCTKCDSTSTVAHNYGSDGNCTVCGQPPPHVHEWKWDGNKSNNLWDHYLVCSCGAKTPEPHQHSAWDGKMGNYFGHSFPCDVCGFALSFEHKYDAAYFNGECCTVCGFPGQGTTVPQTKPSETAPAETRPAETEPKETTPVETGPAESQPKETELSEAKPTEIEPEETLPPKTAKEDLQRSDTTWIWVAAVIVVAGGLGTAVFFWKKKS